MTDPFQETFKILTGHSPFPWQVNLYERFISDSENNIPAIAAIPTGLGKTNVIAIWLIALANRPGKMPRRLVYVVNRRTVVDQTTDEVEKIRRNLEGNPGLEARLGSLAISTLRGQFSDNQTWSADPSRRAVICGTVDMIGSRLLFSGYRIGYKSKPLHAGFLGQDALLVHDEAHLEPAFQKLVEKIQEEQHAGECVEDLPWPKLRVMALSATIRSTLKEDSTSVKDNILRLSEKDYEHEIVKKRIEATKKLVLHSIDDEKNLVNEIVNRALAYKESNKAVLVFAHKVEHVEKIVDGITKALKKDKLPENIESLTGTLRGLERDDLVKTPVFQRFLHDSNRDAGNDTVYLVCTSAGEVGVNISAAHLVCDLSTFDSMAQRFGRVNRFGDCDDTRIDVVHQESFEVKISEFDDRRQQTLKLLTQLNGDASPAALEKLVEQDRHAAFSPEPTILPATDILFDAWSLTTIRDKMPGRPPVEPYLHGVSEWDLPQTQVAWREEVEIITGDLLESYKPQDLLEAYPLKAHELLRDTSKRVFDKLQILAKRHPESRVWLVGERGAIEAMSLEELADKNKKDRINGKTVLLSPQAGGLNGGLLDGKADSADDVADQWFGEESVQRRIRLWDDAQPPEGVDLKEMTLRRSIDLNPNAGEFDSVDEADDESSEGSSKKRDWRWYILPRNVEDSNQASTEPITWQHHTKDVVDRAEEIVEALNWPQAFDELKQAIILAAEFHDLGKKRVQWQRSIGNPSPTDWHAKSGKDPETGKRWKRKNCCPHYRHEFGSLLDVLDPEQEHFAEFKKLSDDMQELVLHLIAAHHGYARPHFPPERTIDPDRPQSQADEQALETPRRFAKLQRKYGRWGLAYLESLLRAADWSASNEPSKVEPSESAKTTKEIRS